MDTPLFYQLPIAVLFLGTIVASLAAIEGGRRLGLRLNRQDSESSGSIGSAVGATLGLLAFILAFTLSLASSRYDARKQLVIDGANAIGTAYLRTDFLPEDQREEAQRLLREWVGLRVAPDSFGGGQGSRDSRPRQGDPVGGLGLGRCREQSSPLSDDGAVRRILQ